MNTKRELNYRMYVQKMNGFTRLPIHDEFGNYMAVRTGDMETVKRNFALVRDNFMVDKGQLSDDPVRNIRYHLIVSVAVIARVCVEGGLSQEEAYTLSDIYIRRADKCGNCEKLLDLFLEMQLDFAEHMHEMRKSAVISLHIRRCIDYIYDHLHEDLSVSTLATVVGLNPTYLSKLFSKETNTTIKHFIISAKINTAENLLRYTDYPSSEIAQSLGFSSQSAFISVFKKHTGLTPRHFRMQYTSQSGEIF